MAYLMTDVAAGSNAALQMQKNMAAAPYVQQETAAAAEETQLKLQQDRIKAQYAGQQAAVEQQQAQANLEKTRLNTMVVESGFKAGEEAKNKLIQLAETPEWKAADDSGRMRLAAATQMASGDVINGTNSLKGAELLDAKRVATEAKQLAMQDEALGKANAALQAVPDADVGAYFDRLPEANKKAVIDQVGQANWNSYDGKQKKQVVSALLMNAKGQTNMQLKEVEVVKAQIAADSRERIEQSREDTRIVLRAMGDASKSDRSMRDWNIFVRAQETLEKSGEKAIVPLDKAVEAAQAKLDKTYFFDAGETAELSKAVAKRDEFKRTQLQKELNLAVSAPDNPAKQVTIDALKTQLKMYPDTEVKPTPVPEDKPAAPKAKSMLDTLPAKPSALSNKVDSGLQSKVEASGIKYEPTKYDYRVAPDGSIQRKAK